MIALCLVGVLVVFAMAWHLRRLDARSSNRDVVSIERARRARAAMGKRAS